MGKRADNLDTDTILFAIVLVVAVELRQGAPKSTLRGMGANLR